jgi:hypothetical protein
MVWVLFIVSPCFTTKAQPKVWQQVDVSHYILLQLERKIILAWRGGGTALLFAVIPTMCGVYLIKTLHLPECIWSILLVVTVTFLQFARLY